MSGRAPAAQLPFDFKWRPAHARDVFHVNAANAPAVAWIDRWPDWPGCILALVGEPGSGKTHLASVWQARCGAHAVSGADLDTAAVPALLDLGLPLVVCRADAAAPRALLHLHNAMVEAQSHLLLTAIMPPARWPAASHLADLASRLRAVPVAAIPRPDDALLRDVLLKLCADRQLHVGDEVLGYLLARLERSFDMARRIVPLLDAASLARQRPVTVTLAREVLAGIAEADAAGAP